MAALALTSPHPPTAACRAPAPSQLAAVRRAGPLKSSFIAPAARGSMATPPPAATAAAAASQAAEERPQQPPAGQLPAQQQERCVVQLQAVDITPENFAPFGQVRWWHLSRKHVGLFGAECRATALPPQQANGGPCLPNGSRLVGHFPMQLVGSNDDGKLFDEEDAQLDLSAGQPRCGAVGRSRPCAGCCCHLRCPAALPCCRPEVHNKHSVCRGMGDWLHTHAVPHFFCDMFSSSAAPSRVLHDAAAPSALPAAYSLPLNSAHTLHAAAPCALPAGQVLHHAPAAPRSPL